MQICRNIIFYEYQCNYTFLFDASRRGRLIALKNSEAVVSSLSISVCTPRSREMWIKSDLEFHQEFRTETSQQKSFQLRRHFRETFRIYGEMDVGGNIGSVKIIGDRCKAANNDIKHEINIKVNPNMCAILSNNLRFARFL